MVIDTLEKLYLCGFALLQAFVTVFPLVAGGKHDPQLVDVRAAGNTSTGSEGPYPPDQAVAAGSAMEFLPLMATSVYCAVGLIWAFLRLSVIYLRQTETTSH